MYPLKYFQPKVPLTPPPPVLQPQAPLPDEPIQPSRAPTDTRLPLKVVIVAVLPIAFPVAPWPLVTPLP